MVLTGVTYGTIEANLFPTAYELCGGKNMSLAMGLSLLSQGMGALASAPISGLHDSMTWCLED